MYHPDSIANKMIARFLEANDLPSNGVTFVEERSDQALPDLDLDQRVDVALIDGSHSFSLPIIDYAG